MRTLLCSTTLLLLAACGQPHTPPPAPAEGVDSAANTMSLLCAGPFAANATKESLIAEFGAENVADMSVPGPEGTELSATVIYPNDVTKRAEVMWADEAKRARPATIRIQNPDSKWTGPSGLKIGMSLEDVEKINGRPFTIMGFGWDYGGTATDWKGGALDSQGGPDDCRVLVRFDSAEGAPTNKVQGDREFSSDNPDIRAAKPEIWHLSIGYPVPEPT